MLTKTICILENIFIIAFKDNFIIFAALFYKTKDNLKKISTMHLNLPEIIHQSNLILTKTLLIMKKETNKTVKMQSKYRPSIKNYRGYKEVPWLTISGNWLAKIGFSIGSMVEIISADNQLIIKKL